METSLKRLDQQETKCSAELDTTLTHYAELQQQAKDMVTIELNTARQVIRPDKERETVQQLQATYRRKFDSSLLVQSRKDIAGLLGEALEPVSIHQKLRQPYEQLDNRHPTKGYNQER